MADGVTWLNILTSFGWLCWRMPALGKTTPLLSTVTESQNSSMVLGGVLLSLAVIYFASKVGGEICAMINLPPVLGQFVGVAILQTGEIEVGNIFYLIISACVFLVGSIVIGRFLSPYFVALVKKLQTRRQLLLTWLSFAFILSYIAVVIQLESILGAFAAGLVLAETEKRKELEKQIIPIADMLIPIFFITVGVKTDFGVLSPGIHSNQEGLVQPIFLIKGFTSTW